MTPGLDESSIYQDLVSLMLRAKRQMFLICENKHLTPVQGMLLISMNPESSRTMNELSELLGCDASNVTGLVDRLESHGYIERASDASDRRIKKIQLTKQGIECRSTILNELKNAEVIDVEKLSQTDIVNLRSIVEKLS